MACYITEEVRLASTCLADQEQRGEVYQSTLFAFQEVMQLSQETFQFVQDVERVMDFFLFRKPPGPGSRLGRLWLFLLTFYFSKKVRASSSKFFDLLTTCFQLIKVD
jgi:hypothetical protein